jgi:hypothetical protein
MLLTVAGDSWRNGTHVCSMFARMSRYGPVAGGTTRHPVSRFAVQPGTSQHFPALSDTTKMASQQTLNPRVRRRRPPTLKSSLSRKSARFHCCCPCHAACRAAHTGGLRACKPGKRADPPWPSWRRHARRDVGHSGPPARERQFSICGAAAAPQRGRTGPATATAQAPGRPRSRPSPQGNWSRPMPHRYQHQFSTRSGNNGK